jgi:hypothetical protein
MRAQAYHEFMLYQKSLEAFKYALDMRMGQAEKENSQKSVNESVYDVKFIGEPAIGNLNLSCNSGVKEAKSFNLPRAS